MNKNFVAINYVHCNEDYRPRFEELFATRARAIDTMPGFVNMHVLRPAKVEEPYVIISYWEHEQAFKDWTKSDTFQQGHKRAFEDIAKAKAEGRPAPMKSDFKTYQIITD